MGVKARVLDGSLEPTQAQGPSGLAEHAPARVKAGADIEERRKAAALASLERNREALALLSKA